MTKHPEFYEWLKQTPCEQLILKLSDQMDSDNARAFVHEVIEDALHTTMNELVGWKRRASEAEYQLDQALAALRARPALSDDERAESLRSLRWIKEFCEAHHADEAAGVHLHRLLVDIPHYLDYVIAVLASEETDTPKPLRRPALSDETLREMAEGWISRPMSKEPWLHPTMLRAFSVRDLVAFARAVLARQQAP